MPGTGSRAGLWRDRDFLLLWSGETISKLGSNVTTVALPLIAVVTLNANTFVVGAVTAAVWLPWLLLGLPAGAWVDRYSRRRIMVACDAVSAVAFVSVPVAACLGALSIAQLLIVAFVTGTASVFFTTAYRVYLPSLVQAARLPEANAKLSGSESAAQLGGRALGGLIAQWAGAVFGLVIDAVSFVVSAVCLLAIRGGERENPVRSRDRDLRAEIGEGLRWLVGDPYLRVFALFGAVGNLALTGYQAIQVVFLVRVVGVSAAVVGALVAVTGAGGIVGALVATRITRRFGTARGLLYCLGCTVPFGFLIPLTARGPALSFLIVGGLLLGAGVVAGNVIAAGFQQVYCPAELRGRVIAGSSVLVYGIIPLGALLAGVLGTAIGLRPTVWIMMGLLVCAASIVLFSPVRHGRNLPTEPVARAPVSR